MRRFLAALLITLLVACDSKGDGSSHDGQRDKAAGSLPRLRMLDAFPKLEFDKPLWLTTPPDGTKRLFVVEQGGRVSWFHAEPAPARSTLFLDISAKTFCGHNEEGLLALAFHPKYKENGYFFVWYTRSKPRRHVLSRFKVSASDAGTAEPASETVFCEIEKPWGNHNGSTLVFGPDGFLYFSVGDGGSGGDPQKNGQNLGSWLAKVHRIDVDKPSGRTPYSVPKDNPFAQTAGARPETWAYGLRNIWRMSFDRQTGELWGGDVGQDKYEEVDLIVKGGNYGWRIREGLHGFANETAKSALIDPVIEYGRRDGSSITGGYVYRGKAIKDLVGAYLYADYVTGTIWALRYDGKQVTAWKEVLRQPKNISSFGEDWDGELYVTCFDGKIYRLAGE